MGEVDRLKNELATALKNSEEYLNYTLCKNKLAEKPELQILVDEVRRLNFEYQNSAETDNSLHIKNEIRSKNESVESQDLAKDFLNAEYCLCRMIQDVCKAIIDDIDLNLDFLK